MTRYIAGRPGSKLKLSNDWSDWLAEGDSIDTRLWTVSPSDATLSGTTAAIVTISGMGKKTYRLNEHVVSVNGEDEDRLIVINNELGVP